MNFDPFYEISFDAFKESPLKIPDNDCPLNKDKIIFNKKADSLNELLKTNQKFRIFYNNFKQINTEYKDYSQKKKIILLILYYIKKFYDNNTDHAKVCAFYLMRLNDYYRWLDTNDIKFIYNYAYKNEKFEFINHFIKEEITTNLDSNANPLKYGVKNCDNEVLLWFLYNCMDNNYSCNGGDKKYIIDIKNNVEKCFNDDVINGYKYYYDCGVKNPIAETINLYIERYNSEKKNEHINNLVKSLKSLKKETPEKIFRIELCIMFKDIYYVPNYIILLEAIWIDFPENTYECLESLIKRDVEYLKWFGKFWYSSVSDDDEKKSQIVLSRLINIFEVIAKHNGYSYFNTLIPTLVIISSLNDNNIARGGKEENITTIGENKYYVEIFKSIFVISKFNNEKLNSLIDSINENYLIRYFNSLPRNTRERKENIKYLENNKNYLKKYINGRRIPFFGQKNIK